ncbi:hypothetical protein BCV71DRAFT_288623 [Rhizopus microsporus]|uniref:DUF4211 domain-containing protein n=1 Tax=Rhizopus microsporus TaxID=58291 RepID=A0A1X0SC86_RHIZD|nr:hypothetical protein BCV71DRAFT_288623 [Rhizopus microsporus]
MPPKLAKQQTLLSYFKKEPVKEKERFEEPLPKEDTKMEISNEEEEDDLLPLRKHNKRKRQITIDDDEEEEEEETVKKTIIQIEDNSSSDTNDDDNDDDTIQDDELMFLDKSDILEQRTRGRQVSRYNKALEKLKDRKSRLQKYDTSEKGPIEKYIRLSDDEEENEEDEEEDEEEDDEKDFVVDDDIIDGVKVSKNKQAVDMPAEFSRDRILSWSRQFKIYVEYLVALAITDKLETTNQFELAKKAVIRRIQSYKDSMVTSDVWLTEFKESMDTHSNWKFKGYLKDEDVSCQACRANKPASYIVSLYSDDAEPVRFYLGSECYRKGQLYHKFTHFESHIYHQVKEQVEKIQTENKEMIDYDDVYEVLAESGYVNDLFRKVKDLFIKTIRIYNLKGERFKIEDTSSSSDNEA